MKNSLILVCFLTVLFGNGCAYPSVKKAHPEKYSPMPIKRLDPAGYASAISTNGETWHGVRMVAASKPDVTLAHKLNPLWWLKNRDDPKPPEWYRKDKKFRRTTWVFRNGGHNFTFYVIGKADKTTVRKGWYPPQNSKPGGGLDFQITEWEYLRFPFLSWKTSWFYFYFGWRERGDFGIELHLGHQKDLDAPKKKRAAPVYNSLHSALRMRTVFYLK